MMSLLHVLPLIVAGTSTTPKQPHILMIVADDFGYNDVGYHQSTAAHPRPHPANPLGRPTTDAAAGVMPTPTLDTLASQGTKLEMYYVQPLCSPTRATFMTGRYPFHTGLGPDVICTSCGDAYGLPAREVLLPALLGKAGYATAAIGKWHLGDCDERYLPTFRGFDHFLGYMAGAQSYYHHAGDFRNGSAGEGLPPCVGESVANNYSTLLYASEAARIVQWHASQTAVNAGTPTTPAGTAGQPLFLYLAFQSVHNPYDVPPLSIVNVNTTFPDIVPYSRRIYAGMVQALDMAVDQVTASFKAAGLWDDTVLIFTTDNGGIGIGNNYPLRGMKVLTWDGGVRGVGFVRGTNSALAKVQAKATSVELMHSTDWLPTLAHLANLGSKQIKLIASRPAADGSEAGSALLRPGGTTVLHAQIGGLRTLALDGYDQWAMISSGGAVATKRETLAHNVPAKARPVLLNATSHKYGTSTCVSYVDVDGRLQPSACHGFGIVGGAIRHGRFKLVWAFSNLTLGLPKGVSTNCPIGTPQYTPGGSSLNRTADTTPQPMNGSLYLFDIVADPTETHNLALRLDDTTHGEEYVRALSTLVALRDALEQAADSVGDQGWVFGFRDPTGTSVDKCMGPKTNSSFCQYGSEFDCAVSGALLKSGETGHAPAGTTPTATACRAACRAAADDVCTWWQLEVPGKKGAARCAFKAERGSGGSAPCPPGSKCAYGPRTCPR